MENLMPKDQELYRRIEEVVHYIWDPIGISDVPEARDEYHGYLMEIYARVKEGDPEGLMQYLKWVIIEQMGMTFDRGGAEKAVDVMMRWKDRIYSQ